MSTKSRIAGGRLPETSGWHLLGHLLGAALIIIMLSSHWAHAGLFEDATSGGTGPADTAGQVESSPQTVEFNGYVRADVYLGKVPDQDVTEIKTGYGELAGKLRLHLGEYGDGYAEARLRQGHQGGQTSGEFDLREAYLDLHLGPLDLRAGQQIIVWGRADAFAPTDNLTPRDMRICSPNEDDARLSNLALRATLNLVPLRWELTWVPFFAPSHFPAFDLPGPLEMGQPSWPDTDFEHGTLATRANFEFAAVEFSLSYLVGYATFPGLELASFALAAPPQVEVRFHAYRHQVAGCDFATTLGSFGLRGEAALRWPEQDQAEYTPLPEIDYVVGIDRQFGDLSVILQYVGKVVLDWQQIPPTGLIDLVEGRTPTPEQLERIMADPEGVAREEIERKTRLVAGQTTRYGHAFTLRLGWSLLHETLLLEVLGYYNIATGEWLARPKLTYDIADGLKVAAGAEIYGGPDDTLFGMIDELQSAGFCEVIAYF